MLDFLVGLDTEFSDMVDGSHLYFPSAVHLEDVVLPQDQKKLIVETVENFAAYKKVRKTLGLDKAGMVGLHPCVFVLHESAMSMLCDLECRGGWYEHVCEDLGMLLLCDYVLTCCDNRAWTCCCGGMQLGVLGVWCCSFMVPAGWARP